VPSGAGHFFFCPSNNLLVGPLHGLSKYVVQSFTTQVLESLNQ
jgi:hypothetical protein